MIDGVKKDIEKLSGKIIEWRRDFHAIRRSLTRRNAHPL